MSPYTRNPRFETNDMSDGVVLFDLERRIAHHLNGPATLIWEASEGRDAASIRSTVQQIMEVPEDEAATIVEEGLARLVQIDALRE